MYKLEDPIHKEIPQRYQVVTDNYIEALILMFTSDDVTFGYNVLTNNFENSINISKMSTSIIDTWISDNIPNQGTVQRHQNIIFFERQDQMLAFKLALM